MIWLRIVVAVLALASAFGFGLWLINRNDRRHAMRVVELRKETPVLHEHYNSGPTRYDRNGRVMF